MSGRRTGRLPRLVAFCGTAALAGTVAAGCGGGGFAGAYSLPLPGGADLGGHPYRVVADFADVLDLVPQAAVKVNDVAVGRVERIDLPVGTWSARVTMLVNGGVHLPANAQAHLAQSSLLGEKYVQLVAPDDGSGTLSDGDEIPLARTNRNPEVEEVLGALSLLLNGGGIAQLHTITTQLNDAMNGNESQLRSMLDQIEALSANLDAHCGDITAALDSLNRLSATLAARDQQLGSVLDDLAPGLRVLDEQRNQLVTMLQSVDTLSGVAVDVVNRSRDDFVADLRALQPILRQLANAGQALPQSLQVLLTYPFTDAVLGDIRGDYLNVYLSVAAAAGTQIVTSVVPDSQVPGGVSPAGGSAAATGGPRTGTPAAPPGGRGSTGGQPSTGSGTPPSGGAGPGTPPLPLPPVSPTAGAPPTSPAPPGSPSQSPQPSGSGTPGAPASGQPPSGGTDSPSPEG